MKKFLEVESKYSAQDIDRMAFKKLVRGLNPTSFIYAEGTDVYYTKSDTDFLRYRMPASGDPTRRSELTFKKKHSESNNIVRTEVNLRIDPNDSETVIAFCEGLGYVRNFSIFKSCDIFFWEDGNVVFYSIIDEDQKIAHFIEIEASEEANLTAEQGWDVIRKYEELLAPLGINAQKRMKLSLFERYKK